MERLSFSLFYVLNEFSINLMRNNCQGNPNQLIKVSQGKLRMYFQTMDLLIVKDSDWIPLDFAPLVITNSLLLKL